MVYKTDVRTIVIQGLAVLVFCAIIEIGAGGVLGGMEGRLALLPGLLMMIPPILDLRGNVNGALASRLGTALHSGIIRPKMMMTTELKNNITSSLILSFLASATIGILAFGVNVLLGRPTIGILTLVMMAVFAGVVSGLILAFVTVGVAVVSFKRGWDPDNVTAPLMATLGDIITVVCLFMAAFVVG
jgi:mgtE-like transporter